MLEMMEHMEKKARSSIKIKYDKNTIQILFTIVILCAALFGISLLLFLEVSGLELLWLVSFYMGGGVGIVSLAALISGKFYLRRLKAYGYVLPECKKDYGGNLENLPKAENNNGKSIFARHSLWGMLGSIGLYFNFMLLDLQYFLKWKFLGDNAKAMFIICALFYLVWLIQAFLLWKQSNPEKYRDDVEPDYSRKERMSLDIILVSTVILGLISAFAMYNAHSMTNYIFQSQIEADRDKAEEIREAVAGAVLEWGENDKQSESYQALSQGTEITYWGTPTDELSQMISDRLYINTFAELQDDFHLADGDAKVWVEFENGRITVLLQNPVKELERYGRHYQEISAGY